LANRYAATYITNFIRRSYAENLYRRVIVYYRGHGLFFTFKDPAFHVVPEGRSLALGYVQHSDNETIYMLTGYTGKAR